DVGLALGLLRGLIPCRALRRNVCVAPWASPLFSRVESSYARRYYSSLVRRVKGRLAIFPFRGPRRAPKGWSLRSATFQDAISHRGFTPGTYRGLPDSRPRAFRGQALSRSSHWFA